MRMNTRICCCGRKVADLKIYLFSATKQDRVGPSLQSRNSLKATVENPRGSVEKLSPKESVEGADTVLRGSVRALKGFSEGKPKAAKPRGRSPRGFAAEGLLEENPKGAFTLPRSTVSAPKALS